MSSNNSIDWNKPKPKDQQTAKKGGVKSSANVKSVVAWLAGAALLVALCVWMFSGGEDVPKDEPANENEQTNNAPPAKTNAAPVAPVKPIDPREDYDHEKLYRDARGILRFKDGNCRAPDPTRPRHATIRMAPTRSQRLFSHPSERAIAAILMAKDNPGIVDPNYADPDFVEDFENSLTNRIVISDSDSPRDRRLKQAVIDAKEELGVRIGKGEKLADILTQAHNEIKRIAAYKKDLKTNLQNLIREGNGELSDADVRDYVAAANKMLEANGAKTVSDDEFVIWNVRLGAERAGRDADEAEIEYREQRANRPVKNEKGDQEK